MQMFQRREYFGQYGKVVKVAMSRTAAGAVQQFPNNTCSVYVSVFLYTFEWLYLVLDELIFVIPYS